MADLRELQTCRYPLASAIDTPLPQPPERQHLMLSSKVRGCIQVATCKMRSMKEAYMEPQCYSIEM